MKLPTSVEGGAGIAVAVPSSREYTEEEFEDAENVILIDGVVHEYLVSGAESPASSGLMLRVS